MPPRRLWQRTQTYLLQSWSRERPRRHFAAGWNRHGQAPDMAYTPEAGPASPLILAGTTTGLPEIICTAINTTTTATVTTTATASTTSTVTGSTDSGHFSGPYYLRPPPLVFHTFP